MESKYFRLFAKRRALGAHSGRNRHGSCVECEEIRALFSDYLDDELDVSARGRVGEHLRRCRTCETLLRNLRITIQALKALAETGWPEQEGFSVWRS